MLASFTTTTTLPESNNEDNEQGVRGNPPSASFLVSESTTAGASTSTLGEENRPMRKAVPELVTINKRYAIA
jgi:hypothetical protein